MNIAGLSIGQPWVLWAILICLPLTLLGWRSRLAVSRKQKLVASASRVLAIVLVILAVADARVRWHTRALAVASVLDTSASISAHEDRALRAAILDQRNERDDVRWIDVIGQTPGARETNLEASIDTAIGLLPTDRVRRILLATDGRETEGSALAAADRARRAGVQVFVLPTGDQPAVDAVAVTGIDAPRLVRAGRDASVGIHMFASSARRVRLDVLRDGLPVSSRSVDLPRGASLQDLGVAFPDDGVHELIVRAACDADPISENNVWRTLVRVVAPPRVLLVHELQGMSPALAQVYRDSHLHVDEVRPTDVPSDVRAFDRYQYVVLDEIVMTSLSESQQRALRSWVEERGGGLLTTTGMHGVGRAPEILREIEPIQPPRSIPEPRPIELILVIDRSGSMQGPNIANARNAGIAAVRALRPDSRVGVVAFSGAADLVVPPVAMTDSDQVVRAIAGIHAGGGTDLAAALDAAARIVSSDPRYLHHVILMSDGESRAGPALAAATALRNTGATITAITLGPRVQLMADIARIGHGRYFVTNTSTSLPALFVHEAQFRSPPPAREIAFHPGVGGHMAFMDGVDPASDAPILGFTEAQPRPGASTLLTTPTGGPLLSHWFVGLGQVATLTTATSGRWADAWRTSPGFRRLFGQMAWEMMRVQSEDNLELHIERVPGRREVRRVFAVAPTTAIQQVPVVTISRGRREGVHLEMRPAAPGVWTANVAIETGFVVDARMPTSLEPTVAAGAEQPYPDELRGFGSDEPTLDAIAHAGGGRVVRRAEDVLRSVESRSVARDIRIPLLVAALVLYLLGVLALRFPGTRSSTRPTSQRQPLVEPDVASTTTERAAA